MLVERVPSIARSVFFRPSSSCEGPKENVQQNFFWSSILNSKFPTTHVGIGEKPITDMTNNLITKSGLAPIDGQMSYTKIIFVSWLKFLV
jgi:hypothetical protein